MKRSFLLALGVLFAIGIVVRGLPQMMGSERYLQHHVSEDGYLMLTIARNIALGLGMSTAEGTMPTNGTQPATTFVWALGFLATGADKAMGVWVALLLQFLAAVISTWLLYRIIASLLGASRNGRIVAGLTAAAWAASQRTCAHVMNCLETGFYTLALLAFACLFFAGGDPLRPWSLRRSLHLGLVLGLVFWVRIDAVFLIGVVCLARFLFATGPRLAPSRQQWNSAVVTGLAAVAVASPWLIYNKVQFGHFTPVSGIAQSANVGLGHNGAHALYSLTEYALVVVPFPQAVFGASWFLVLSAVVTVGAVVSCVLVFRNSAPAVRTAILVFGSFGSCLAVYYGLFFGAAHFVSRYLFPCSMLLAGTTIGCLVALWSRLPSSVRPAAWLAAGLSLIGVVGATQWRAFHKNARHLHWQVVEFVRGIPPTTWVAAVQTGTLGFFHDRTINLDGKVNPEALAAGLRGEDAYHQYFVDSKADYLIDWVGMAKFVSDHPRQYAGRMKVLVEDHERNLAVLQRIR